MRIAVIGTVVVVLYAVLGVAQLLVLDPLAAVPGSDLSQIYARVPAAGESMDVGLVLVLMAVPVVLAAALLLLTVRRPQLPPAATGALYLGVLVLAAPLLFFASISPGIAVADTFAVSGGAHTPWVAILYVTSLLALIGAAICLAQLASPGRALTRA